MRANLAVDDIDVLEIQLKDINLILTRWIKMYTHFWVYCGLDGSFSNNVAFEIIWFHDNVPNTALTSCQLLMNNLLEAKFFLSFHVTGFLLFLVNIRKRYCIRVSVRDWGVYLNDHSHKHKQMICVYSAESKVIKIIEKVDEFYPCHCLHNKQVPVFLFCTFGKWKLPILIVL